MLTETVARLEPVDALADVRADWSRIAAAGGNVFASWEWAAVWWRHFGGERVPSVHAVLGSGGDVSAILPLYVWRRRPARVLRFIGHGVSDQLGPLCSPEARGDAAVALRASLAECDVLLMENVPAVERWPDVLGGAVLRREASPFLRAPSWDGFLASRSANFRQQVGRRERGLRRRHDVRFRLAADRSALDHDLDVLFALHDARWGARSAFGGAREPFHRDFARLALERGWLRLWFLEVGGRPVAATYGFRFGGVESYYQSGRDPSWERGSVGFVLLAHAIRSALADGVTEYRLLRGADSYKLRFATGDAPLDTLALASGRRGRSVIAAAGLLRRTPRLRKALRRPLEA